MLEVIKEKYKEFAAFLDGIAIEEIEKECSRSELKDLSKELSNINLRSFSYEITKMIQKKKEEEYPELLGIHHYPVLKEIDFLSEDKKLELDKFLARFVVGNELSGLSRMMYSNDLKRLEEFLIEKGIAEAKFYACCTTCGGGWISKLLTIDEKKLVETLLEDKKNEDRSEMLEGYLEYYCSQCDDEPDIERIDTVNFGRLLKIVQGRDKSLDNV
ncbi:hypothetical protein [Bacillus toyonensis]|uniref:hypothetical protein n=1 Tax=Bacillus toyonensis TaxID=155322 RepID=UPI002E22BA1B|nr:hypothetical protein [Bacillus toyonensis]